VFRVANLWQFALFKKFGSIDMKAEWTKRGGADCAIELHVNSDKARKGKGHEVWVHPKCAESQKLAGQLSRQMGLRLPCKNRGVKLKRFRLLKKLLTARTPGCIVEPSFIHEPHLQRTNFRVMTVSALSNGLYKYLGV
jgi:N-acetylmuramoyl-L-alanine amidase